MTRLAPLLLAAAALTGCVAVPPPAPAPDGSAAAWVVFDRTGPLGSGAEGLADRAAGRPLTIDDPVRIASISKLVVAIGVMRLVEEGVLDLDADVSHRLGFALRNPAFPDRPVTLRHLLSHTSGLRDSVNYAVPLGARLRDTLADPAAFDPGHPPGAFFAYANLGSPVVAQVMERATGERFDLLMRRLVISPLGLDACFNWPTCSDAAVARAGVLYDERGVVARDALNGRRPDCPVVPSADGRCDWQAYAVGTNGALFSPQGGLRISASDLARIGRLLLDRGAPLIGEAAFAEMTRLHWRFDGGNGDSESGFYCGYGLGVQILAQCAPGDDPFGDGRPRFGHAGDAYRLRSGLWVDPAAGRGIAYFATAVAVDAPRGASAYRQAEERLARRLLTP
ncbi:MAG: serine hydrolase domain-containing protein [Allosphingosinicella sp.]|uniref:serine hydrolase domain-containing protein n=1 Tax=Allosphingosinicella sp. TaxID=2823234 RepID=UPI00395522F2